MRNKAGHDLKLFSDFAKAVADVIQSPMVMDLAIKFDEEQNTVSDLRLIIGHQKLVNYYEAFKLTCLIAYSGAMGSLSGRFESHQPLIIKLLGFIPAPYDAFATATDLIYGNINDVRMNNKDVNLIKKLGTLNQAEEIIENFARKLTLKQSEFIESVNFSHADNNFIKYFKNIKKHFKIDLYNTDEKKLANEDARVFLKEIIISEHTSSDDVLPQAMYSILSNHGVNIKDQAISNLENAFQTSLSPEVSSESSIDLLGDTAIE